MQLQHSYDPKVKGTLIARWRVGRMTGLKVESSKSQSSKSSSAVRSTAAAAKPAKPARAAAKKAASYVDLDDRSNPTCTLFIAAKSTTGRTCIALHRPVYCDAHHSIYHDA